MMPKQSPIAAPAAEVYFENLLDSSRNLVVDVLAVTGEHPVLLFSAPESDAPKRLVIAGFDDAEPSGPMAVLHYLQNHELEPGVSFLPMVNPNRFFGQANGLVNQGFVHQDRELTDEGWALIDQLDSIVNLGKDGTLVIQEGKTVTTPRIDTRDEALKEKISASSLFPAWRSGEIPCDGSFEDYLSHLGVPTARTVTPARWGFTARVEATADLISRFARTTSNTGGF